MRVNARATPAGWEELGTDERIELVRLMNPECKKQILYVEDSTTSQWVLKQKLAKLADITNAVSLAEGRALLDRKHFDLVILDWSLPDGTSIRLISEIRAQYSTTQLPIILVSSSLDKIMTSQALQAGQRMQSQTHRLGRVHRTRQANDRKAIRQRPGQQWGGGHLD